MNNELEKTSKHSVMAQFQTLYRHLQHHNKSGYFSRLKFHSASSPKQVKRITTRAILTYSSHIAEILGRPDWTSLIIKQLSSFILKLKLPTWYDLVDAIMLVRIPTQLSLYQAIKSIQSRPYWEVTVSSASKKFPWNLIFITLFITARHLAHYRDQIKSTPSHLIILRSFLILSVHLHLGLPSGRCLSGFPNKPHAPPNACNFTSHAGTFLN
jgi:hypothetical protein